MGAMAAASPPLNSLPVGFRFHPTDEELVSHYLKRKIDGRIDPSASAVIPLVDVCKSEPWDLPDKAGFRSGDPEWFFFAAKDRKYPGGSRSNRATEAGYWKATGKDRMIRSRAAGGKAPVLIGTKKTLVFHTGRAPKGERTGWIMHEYRTVEPEFEYGAQGGFVLCRLFKKPLEKSSVTCVDDMENNVSSLAAKVFSPVDTQDGPDVPEEFATPSNQEMAPGDFHEETQPLADEIGSTTYPLVMENSYCTTDNHETEMDDPLLEALMQFCSPEQEPLVSDGFPGITSPMRPYTDHPFFEDIKHDYLHDFCEVVNTQEDSVTEFLSSVLGNQDDYSSEVSSTQRDSTFERVAKPVFYKPNKKGASPLDLVSGKESASSSDIETDLAQAFPSFVASEWFCEPPNSSSNQAPLSISSSNQDDISKVNDSDSMTSAAHSSHAFYGMDGLTNQDEFERTEIKFGTAQPWQPADSDMQEPIGQENLAHNPATFQGTGIKVRPRQRRLLNSGGSVSAHQGTASRRIRLQIGLMTDTLSTSSHDDDNQAKAARTEEEESSYQNIAGAEVSKPASQDKLAVFTDDGDTSSTNTDAILSEFNRKSDPQLRCRKQKANSVGTTLKGLSDPMRNRAGSSQYFMITGRAAIYVICLILLCVGMWWCMTPQHVQIENNHM